MLFGFNEKGRFVRLDKPILPGNKVEWVRVFARLDLEDSFGRVTIDTHSTRELVPQARDVFLRQAIRKDAVAIPTPKARENPAGSVIRARLLIQRKTADHRRQNRRNRASTRSNPQTDNGTILALLTELNGNTRDGHGVQDMDDCSNDRGIFTSSVAADAMLLGCPVGGLEFFLDKF